MTLLDLLRDHFIGLGYRITRHDYLSGDTLQLIGMNTGPMTLTEDDGVIVATHLYTGLTGMFEASCPTFIEDLEKWIRSPGATLLSLFSRDGDET